MVEVRSPRAWAFLFVVLGSISGQLAQAQLPAAKEQKPAVEGKAAVIERAPLNLRNAQDFAVTLHLDPVRTVTISAPANGTVSTIQAKLGEKVQARSEVARLDTQARELEMARAQAAYRAAQEDRKTAESPAAAAAEARVEAAKADLDLAKLRLDQCNLQSPLTGVVTAIHVIEGEFVLAGAPVITVIDSSQLRVELPVDGRTVTAGASIQLKVEDTTVPATVQTILPLSERFEPLRDLFLSVATAVAIVENPTGNLRAGQTVYSDMIPRLPVTEIPTAALSNTGEGDRKVQVIREGFVRDVPVQLLGQMGEDHVFVSGRFGPTDELVLKSSERLLDGSRVVPHVETDAVEKAPKPNGPPGAGF